MHESSKCLDFYSEQCNAMKFKYLKLSIKCYVIQVFNELFYKLYWDNLSLCS